MYCLDNRSFINDIYAKIAGVIRITPGEIAGVIRITPGKTARVIRITPNPFLASKK